MNKTKSYHEHSDYDKEPAGLRKLDFIVEAIDKYIKNKEKSEIKILDIGCGKGNISIALASLGHQVLGIDLNAPSVESAKKKNKFKNAEFKVQNATKLDPSEKYDCIIASEVFEHIEKPSEFAKKIKNNLNENGILIATIPNGKSLEETIRKYSSNTELGRKLKKSVKKKIDEEIVQTLSDSPHIHFFSLKEFKNLLDDAGYNILSIRNAAAIFKESFYLVLRYILKRDSKLFNKLDEIDYKLADSIPLVIGDGWMIVAGVKK